MKKNFKEVNQEMLALGLKDALEGKKAKLDEKAMKEVIEKAKIEQQKKMQEKIKETAKENKKQNDAFLDKNSKKDDVETTKSGLQYKNITENLSAQDKEDLLSYLKQKPVLDKKIKPADTSEVTVSYVGYFLDKHGKKHVFDSSKKRNEATSFSVNQVIKGWQEGLKLMHKGESFQFFIPSDLAYGENGIPGFIPPNSLLIFKVSLVSVKTPKPTEPEKNTTKETKK